MILKDIAIIAFPGNRTKAYLQNLAKNNFFPEFVLVVGNDQVVKTKPQHPDLFDETIPIQQTLEQHNIKHKKIEAITINNKKVIEETKNLDQKYIIFTGGGIVKKEMFETGKKFIHCHPGRVPEFRGSTCFYYSILDEDNCSATSFFMEQEIDTGDIIAEKEFGMPQVLDIDNIWDPYMRAELLVEVMKNYAKKGDFETKTQNSEEGETYFVIHPVLKHIAMLTNERHQASGS